MVEDIGIKRVEELLSQRKWAKHCLRVNIAKPEDIKVYGKVKVATVPSNLLNPKKEAELREAILAIAPEHWGDETQIILNKNLTCQRHKDGNKEHSWLFWLGDFTGGALVFDDGVRIEEKYTWHKMNGQTHHWNEEHEGTKYGIVLYRSNGPSKTSKLQEARRRKMEALRQSSQGNAIPEYPGESQGA